MNNYQEHDTIIIGAGVYADKIHNMVCEPSFKITARKGEYIMWLTPG